MAEQKERAAKKQIKLLLFYFSVIILFFTIIIGAAAIVDDFCSKERMAEVNEYLEKDPIISVDGAVTEADYVNFEWYTKYKYDEEKNILYIYK